MVGIYEDVNRSFGFDIIFKSFRKLKELKLIEDTPTSKIRSAAMGRVEVKGRATPFDDAIRSPFTGKDCCYCKWAIEEFKSGFGQREWVTLRASHSGDMFYIDDGTGKALVDMRHATVDMPCRYSSGEVDERTSEFLDEWKVDRKGVFFKRQFRFTETYIEVGEEVYVMGQAAHNPYVLDREGKNTGAEIIIRERGGDCLIVSSKSEKELIRDYKVRVVILALVGILIVMYGVMYVLDMANIS